MDGLILIDKPIGITSHDAVDRVRVIAKTRRVGHAGTLDPFASGLLIIGINKGTKALTNLVGLDKTYEATACLGKTSTTDDPEGEVSERQGWCRDPAAREQRCPEDEKDAHLLPAPNDIEMVLDRFRGTYLQTAPAFSAKKVGGKKLYDLARKGKLEGIELPKKEVTITDLAIIQYAWPELTFRVTCSSGTYIRALARDVGEALGCGAYLTALRRTAIGTYGINHAIPLAELDMHTLQKQLLPL